MPVTPETYAVILMGLWGACVGSFLNVVVYRVPEGLSVVSPPSRCPQCEKKLAWYDNVPIFGWLWLRGKCRNCKMKISVQYPLVEAFTAMAFAGLTWAYYFTDLRPVFCDAGLLATWPVLGVHLTLLACMIAASVIDAKLYIIPLGIVWTASLVALVAPASGLAGLISFNYLEVGSWWASLVPVASPNEGRMAIAAGLGLVLSLVLLWRQWIPLSFADEPELPDGADPDDPNLILVHPHPRREVGKEVLFLAPPVVLGLLSLIFAVEVQFIPYDANESITEATAWPGPNAFLGVLLGYLIGGGVVWFIRIFGTLLFGKEAMGLGDVHLMAAVGAVIGWRDATLAFFLAPFVGIVVVIVTAGVGAVLKGRTRVIPYGPSLCVATVFVMLFRNEIWAYLLPTLG
ncbi:MAG: prepilin peptidase [Planctomycetota bacterium]